MLGINVELTNTSKAFPEGAVKMRLNKLLYGVFILSAKFEAPFILFPFHSPVKTNKPMPLFTLAAVRG